MKSIDKAVELSAHATRNVFKRNLTRFAVALVAVFASFVAVPNATLAAPNVVFMIMQPDWKKAGRSTEPLARAQMQYSSRIKIQKRDLRQ